MKQILLRPNLIAAVLSALVCLLVIGSSSHRTPVPIAVSLTVTDHKLRVSGIDTTLHTVATLVVDYVDRFPYIDNASCRLLYPSREGGQASLGYVDLRTGVRHTYLRELTGIDFVNWLPDGRHVWIQYTGSDQVRAYALLDTMTGASRPVDFGQVDPWPPRSLAWSPDSRHGVLYGRRGDYFYAFLVDTATGTLTPLDARRTQSYVWSPDSRFFAATDFNEYVTLTDIATMTTRDQAAGQLLIRTGLTWTPDNRLLFFARPTGSRAEFQGYVWSPESTKSEAMAIKLHVGIAMRLSERDAWSPDGTRLMYEDAEHHLHIIDTGTGVEITDVTPPDTDGFAGYHWSPDSRYLVSNNNGPDMLVFTDTLTNTTTTLNVNAGRESFDAFATDWFTTSEPGLFDGKTRKLGRVIFSSGVPEFRAEYPLPGAYRAAYCEPEMNA